METVRADIERTGAKLVTWVSDQYARDPEGTLFKQRNCSFRRYELTSEQVFEYFVHGHPKWSTKIIPKLMTSVCHRSVLEAVRDSGAGRVCLPVAPDFTSGFLMLAHSEWVLAVDETMYVSIGTGNGAEFRRGGELADRFRRDLGMEWHEMVDRMPSDACFAHALVLNDLMRVRDAVPDRLGYVEIDHVQYYLGCLNDYVKTSRHGVMRDEDLSSLLNSLDAEPAEVRSRVEHTKLYREATQGPSDSVARAMKRKLKDTVQQAGPRFDNVFDALAWDQENPRSPSDESFLDLTAGLDDMKVAVSGGVAGKSKRSAAQAPEPQTTSVSTAVAEPAPPAAPDSRAQPAEKPQPNGAASVAPAVVESSPADEPPLETPPATPAEEKAARAAQKARRAASREAKDAARREKETARGQKEQARKAKHKARVRRSPRRVVRTLRARVRLRSRLRALFGG
jgi:hypothetical protein